MSIIKLEETDSTNLWAKNNLGDLSDRSVVISERQNAGRGRLNRKWIDLGHDNIFMSIVLKPSGLFSNVYTNLTQYMSVIICKVLEQYKIQPTIKWPNDVLVNGKKISGILSEVITCGNSLKGIILGVGLNINSDIDSLKLIKDKEATALNIEINQEHVNKDVFIKKLLDEFFESYDRFLNLGFKAINDAYRKRFLYIGKCVSVQGINGLISGVVSDITDNGELILLSDDKKLILNMGDIL